ncbi:hypothetical protein [Methylocystis sp. B8]|uniref:hypothetical protein n=1 Tax=Methylocystis sp. B8 TaxID=544938 RepID=UPI0010FD99AD|nr:hypothetical protein [Methylocystis sp. B8]TLG77015.1 hypothetical protein FEV16_09810 [Methylocystis sp. B8]
MEQGWVDNIKKGWGVVIDNLSPGWVGSLIGIIGILIGLIFYFRSRQRARLVCQKSALRLLGHKHIELPSEISVNFRGREIPRLARAALVIWNDGEKTISGDEIVSHDPLRIEVDQYGEVLSAVVVKSTRKVISACVEPVTNPCNRAIIKFEFLDPGDGFVCEVLHTAEKKLPYLNGTIKGIPKGILVLGDFVVFPKTLPNISRIILNSAHWVGFFSVRS